MLPVLELEYHCLESYNCFMWKFKGDVAIYFMYIKNPIPLLGTIFNELLMIQRKTANNKTFSLVFCNQPPIPFNFRGLTKTNNLVV